MLSGYHQIIKDMEKIPNIQLTDGQRRDLTEIADQLHQRDMEELGQPYDKLSTANQMFLLNAFQDVILYYQQRIKETEALITHLSHESL